MSDWQLPCPVPCRSHLPIDEAAQPLGTPQGLCWWTLLPIQAPFTSSALPPAVCSHVRPLDGPTPGPLHWLCLLSRTLFPRCLHGPCPHFSSGFQQERSFLSKKNFKRYSFIHFIWLPQISAAARKIFVASRGIFPCGV